MADGLAHALDLVLAAFVQRQLELRRAKTPNTGRSGAAVLELDACRELLQRLVVGRAFHLDLVELLDAVARMREPVRERAVVRQEQCARRVRIEPADRDNSFRDFLDELDDGRAAFRIAGRPSIVVVSTLSPTLPPAAVAAEASVRAGRGLVKARRDRPSCHNTVSPTSRRLMYSPADFAAAAGMKMPPPSFAANPTSGGFSVRALTSITPRACSRRSRVPVSGN